jgi:DNA-binding NtrC family response regulator
VAVVQEDGRDSILREVVSASPSMAELLQVTLAFTRSALPVLIEGPPGSGKSWLALLLHRLGAASSLPFVHVEVGPEASFPSRLATALASFPQGAEGGTLCLEEVGDLLPDDQGALFGLLDELAAASIRVVSTTRRDLRSEIRQSRFRADLFYRLRGLLLRMPGLEERSEDLPLLVRRFLDEWRRRGHEMGGEMEIDGAALDLLVRHAWEGNVRELLLVLEQAALLAAPRGTLLPEDLRFGAPAALERSSVDGGLRGYRREQERKLVTEALEATGWNVSAAARHLGISRVGLSKKIKVLGLRRPSL